MVKFKPFREFQKPLIGFTPEAGIIVAGEAVTEANDRNQLKPVIEKTESNIQEKVKEVAVDVREGENKED